MSENKHLELGKMWLERNRPEKAEPELKKAVAADPDDPMVYAQLALCQLQIENCTEAAAHARKAIGLEPDWAFPFFVHAGALLGMGKVKRAEKAIREAIKLDPAEALYRGSLSTIQGEQKKWQLALKSAEKGLELDPADDTCAEARAMALIQLGRTEDADLALEKAMQNAPDDPDVHAMMGYSRLSEGKPREAVEHYRDALALDPTSEMARDGLVEALKARNIVYRMVLKWFLLLTRISPGWAWAIMIGSVVVRRIMIKAARSVPELAPFIWPVFFAMIGFILLTWVAVPLFNLLLRLDKLGRHALTDRDIRQTNWLLGALGVVTAFIVLWLLEVPAMGMAAIFSAAIIIPLMTTLTGNSTRTRVILGGWTAALVLFAGINVYLEYDLAKKIDALAPVVETEKEPEPPVPEETTSDEPTLEELKAFLIARLKKTYDLDEEELDKEVNLYLKDEKSMEEIRISYLAEKYRVSVKADWEKEASLPPELESQEDAAGLLLMLFIIGWVAFTWVSNLVLAKDGPA